MTFAVIGYFVILIFCLKTSITLVWIDLLLVILLEWVKS